MQPQRRSSRAVALFLVQASDQRPQLVLQKIDLRGIQVSGEVPIGGDRRIDQLFVR